MNSKPDFIYRIKRLSDGLYSTGGMLPKFTKNGKYWTKISHIKIHLKQASYSYNDKCYKTTKRLYGDLSQYVIERIKVLYSDPTHLNFLDL